jgi:hypothetical protein
MADLFTITYEAGTNGNAVAGESGWDTISGTSTYQNTVVANGSLGVVCTDQGILRKNVSSTANARMRWFFRVPVVSAGTNALMAMARVGTTSTCSVRYESAGTLRLVNVSTATGSSSAALVADQLVRCEWAINGTAGTQALEIYRGANAHGTTPDETLSGTFTNTAFDNIGVGWYVLVSGFSIFYDEIKATDAPTVAIGGFSAAPEFVVPGGRIFVF